MIAISSRSAVHASTRIRRNSARRSHGIAANIVRSKSTSVSTVASKPGCVRSTASPARAVSCLRRFSSETGIALSSRTIVTSFQRAVGEPLKIGMSSEVSKMTVV